MLKNDISEQVRLIENLELKLTEFNSQRALAKIEKHLEVREIGKCKLLIDTTSPQSAYYNRIKGFSSEGLPDLEKILDVYQQLSIAPCFDMTPNNVTDLVAVELHRHGFYDSDQLVFMNLRPEQRDQPKRHDQTKGFHRVFFNAFFKDLIDLPQVRHLFCLT